MKRILLSLAVSSLLAQSLFGAPGRVSTLSATNVGATEVTLQWIVPQSSRPITNVDLRTSTNSITSKNWAKKQRLADIHESGAKGTLQTVVIYNLPSSVTNYFGVKLQDDQRQYSLLSNVIGVEMLRVVTNTNGVSETNLTGSVTLEWDPSPDTSVAGYAVHYGTTSSNYTFRVDAGTSTRITVTNLTAGVTYYFVATAYTADGQESLPSNEIAYTVPNNEGTYIFTEEERAICQSSSRKRKLFNLVPTVSYIAVGR